MVKAGEGEDALGCSCWSWWSQGLSVTRLELVVPGLVCGQAGAGDPRACLWPGWGWWSQGLSVARLGARAVGLRFCCAPLRCLNLG